MLYNNKWAKHDCGSCTMLCAIVASQSRGNSAAMWPDGRALPQCRRHGQPTWPARPGALGPWPAKPPAQPSPARPVVTQTTKLSDYYNIDNNHYKGSITTCNSHNLLKTVVHSSNLSTCIHHNKEKLHLVLTFLPFVQIININKISHNTEITMKNCAIK